MKEQTELEEIRANLAAMEGQTPVAEIGSTATLYWCGSEPVADIFNRHGLKVGDKLYAKPAPADKPAVAVPENLRQWYIDLTNSDQVHDDGEISGYFCSTEMLSRLERIIAPSHSQQSADIESERFCDSHCTWRDHHPDCTSHEIEQSASPAPDSEGDV